MLPNTLIRPALKLFLSGISREMPTSRLFSLVIKANFWAYNPHRRRMSAGRGTRIPRIDNQAGLGELRRRGRPVSLLSFKAWQISSSVAPILWRDRIYFNTSCRNVGVFPPIAAAAVREVELPAVNSGDAGLSIGIVWR